MRATLERYRMLFEFIDEGFCVLEKIAGAPLDYRFALANPAFAVQSGLCNVVEKTLRQVMPGDCEGWLQICDTVFTRGEPMRFERELASQRRILEVYAFRIDDPVFPGVGVSFRDITERQQAESMLRESEARYRDLFDSMDEGYCVIEVIFDAQQNAVDYRFLQVNPSFEKHSGLCNAAGKRISKLAPEHESYWYDIYGKVALTGEPVRMVNKAEALGGRWFDLNAFRVGGPDSRRVAVLFTDITARREAEIALRQSLREQRAAESELLRIQAALSEEKAALEAHAAALEQANERLVMATIEAHEMAEEVEQTKRQLAHLAQHDALTGLPNRILLKERLAQAISLAHRQGKLFAVLFLDLDRFKAVNDSLGHEVGDRLLQSVAARLTDCVRSSDTVCRQGGDEFVTLLADIEQPRDAASIAQKILEVLAASHRIDPFELRVTISIGISLFPADGSDAETLIRQADTAMYQAKESGRNNFQFAQQALNVLAD